MPPGGKEAKRHWVPSGTKLQFQRLVNQGRGEIVANSIVGCSVRFCLKESNNNKNDEGVWGEQDGFRLWLPSPWKPLL